jgi:hypothetical protein
MILLTGAEISRFDEIDGMGIVIMECCNIPFFHYSITPW